jgi:hypothetical protein
MQVSRLLIPSLRPLPPLYTWPAPLKQLILSLAIIACFGAYILLFGTVIAIVTLILGG